MTTIAEAVYAAAQRLRDVAGDDARLEADVLVAHAMGIDRAHALARLKDPIPADGAAAFDAMVERRVTHEPLAYIVGYREFYGVSIVCWEDALIPRPETEMLVDLALAEIGRRGSDLRIVDVGTGSGAVAVAIAQNAPRSRIAAADASDDALAVAIQNIRTYRLEERVVVKRTDLLEGLGVFDVIVANLPYVSEREWRHLDPEIREHEPRAALVGGVQGTETIARMIAQAPLHVAPDGVLAAEIGETQGEAVLVDAARAFPEGRSYVMKDLAGKDRVLVIRTRGDGSG